MHEVKNKKSNRIKIKQNYQIALTYLSSNTEKMSQIASKV